MLKLRDKQRNSPSNVAVERRSRGVLACAAAALGAVMLSAISEAAADSMSLGAAGPQNANHIFVLGTDGNMWLEHAPFGEGIPRREQVDGNVRAFQGLDRRTAFALGACQQGYVWREAFGANGPRLRHPAGEG